MVQSKLFIPLFIVMSFSAISGFGQWTKLNSGTTHELYNIRFRDKNIGFCVGGNEISKQAGNGIILKTADGGTNWNKVYEDSISVFREVAIDKNNIAVSGVDKYGQNILVLSTDGGATWRPDTVSFNAFSLSYYNGKLHYVDLANGNLEQYDGSNTKTVLSRALFYTTNNNNDLFAVCYASTTGYTFKFVNSKDGGNTWDSSLVNLNNITTNSLSGASLWAFGNTVVFLATYPSAVAYSFDRGHSWKDTVVEFGTWDAFATSPYTFTGVSSFNRIIKTKDGGTTKQVQDSTTDNANRFFFVDEQIGYLCGKNGIIYKTTNGGDPTNITQLQNRNIIKVYPNPLKEFINIETTVPLNNAQLAIYNTGGQLIRTIDRIEGKKITEAVNVPSRGTYMYILKQDGVILSSGRIIAGD